MPLHRLLEMQLSKCNLRLDQLPPEIQTLLQHVNEEYAKSDTHREMTQRSLQLSSQDLNVRNRELLTQQILATAARENAQESENRLRLAIEGADFGTFTWDAERNLFEGSLRTREMLGLPAGGQGTFEEMLSSIHPDDGERVTKGINMALKDFGEFSGRCRLVKPQGNVRWLDIRGRAVEAGQSGRIGGAALFYGFLRDVTNEETAHHLNESLAAVVESFQAGMVSATVTGEIVNWNKGALLLYGCTSQEMLGVHISSLVEPDKRMELQNALDSIAKGGAAPDPIESRYTQPNGRQVWLALHVSPLRDSEGRIFGVSLVIGEMTSPKQVHAAQEEHKASLTAMRKFDGALSVIAHELRTPLGGIRATLELLAGKSSCDPANDRLVKTALDAIVQASSVVNDLLEVTRISNGCADWTWSEFDLASALDIAVSAFQSEPLPAQVAFHCAFTPSDARMWGDLQAVSRLLCFC